VLIVESDVIFCWVGEAGEVSVRRDVCESFRAYTSSVGSISSLTLDLNSKKKKKPYTVLRYVFMHASTSSSPYWTIVSLFKSLPPTFALSIQSLTRRRNKPNIQLPPWKQVRWLEVW
jgi:hypothetical protein